jgi:hypothetical protein
MADIRLQLIPPSEPLYEAHPAAQQSHTLQKFPFGFVHVLGLKRADLHGRTSDSKCCGRLHLHSDLGAAGHPMLVQRPNRFSFGLRRRSCSASLVMCTAGNSDPQTYDAMEDINAMSSAELKSELLAMGISITDCFEKSDLKSRLQEARSRVTSKTSLQRQMLRAGGVKTKLVRLRADEGSLGDNVRIDDKCYYAITLHFSESGGLCADFVLMIIFSALPAKTWVSVVVCL